MKRFSSSVLLCTLALSGCLTPTGTQKPAEAISYGQGGAGTTGMHTILGGDTVYTVSQQYNLPLREIISINNLAAPYHLKTGYRLKLPPPNEYKVQGGDTLNGISRLFNVSVSEMAKMNDLPAPYTLEKGQVIRLPARQPKLEQEFASNAPMPSFGGEQLSAPMKVGSVEAEVLAPPPGMEQNQSVTPAVITSSPATASQSGFPPQPSAKSAEAAAPVVKPAEVQKVAATIAPKIPARSGTGRFMRPVDGTVISKFGPKDDGMHNDGINIKATRGTAVRAAENGVIAYTGNELSGYGNLVLVRHADRYMTAYAHLDKTLVKKGDTVKAGQSIGTVGSTGQVDSPQLHFEVRKGTQALNPDLYL